MKSIRQPSNARGRADEIGDMTTEWFELNDQHGVDRARRMLDANAVADAVSSYGSQRSGARRAQSA